MKKIFFVFLLSAVISASIFVLKFFTSSSFFFSLKMYSILKTEIFSIAEKRGDSKPIRLEVHNGGSAHINSYYALMLISALRVFDTRFDSVGDGMEFFRSLHSISVSERQAQKC